MVGRHRTTARGPAGRGRLSAIGTVAAAVSLVVGCSSVTGSPSREGSTAPGDTGDPVASSPQTRDDMPEPPPTSTQLIAEATAAGMIDEPTALLYRTWSTFGDPRLPQEFIGAPETHDLALIAQLRERLDDLPDDIRAQIEPFLLRPSNPASIFSTGTPAGLRSSQGALAAAAQPRADESGDGQVPDDNDLKPRRDPNHKKPPPLPACPGWLTEAVPHQPFRVWTCEVLDDSGLDGATHALDMVVGMVGSHAGEMIRDMGPVLPDDPSTDAHPDADEKIDIYILPTGWTGPKRGTNRHDTDFGLTISAAPYGDVTASSYVLLAAEHLGDRDLAERMLVHEMFHVLQYAHHVKLRFKFPDDTGKTTAIGSWYVEASAEWAASYYVRGDSARLHKDRLPLVHDRYLDWSLTSPVGVRPYGAYIWPLYMEQQAGPEAVFASWRALAALPAYPEWTRIIEAISETVDMGAEFPEFVMRLLNADLPGDPIKTRFVSLDGHFPDGRLPTMKESTLDKDTVDFSVGAAGSELPGLGYRYYRVAVPPSPGTPEAAEVAVTISGDIVTRTGASVSVEALAQDLNGNYQRHAIELRGEGTDLCVKDDVILALANPQIDVLDGAEGTITLTRDEDRVCARVEASHPETLARLATVGDEVRVRGTEGDGEPDVAPLVISVFGAPEGALDRFGVDVGLVGETLLAPRDMGWSLMDFDEVVPGTYRTSVPVQLDIDLTDENRELTIDARLRLDKEEVGRHTAKVELHGGVDAQCFFEIVWTGSDTVLDPDGGPWLTDGSGPPLSDVDLLTPDGTEATVVAHDAQAGDIPLLPVDHGSDGGWGLHMNALSDWGGSSPSTAPDYLWSLDFGPDLYEHGTGRIEVPLAASPTNRGMQLDISGSPGGSYSGPATVEILRNDSGYNSNLGYPTVRNLAGTFTATLTGDRGGSVNVVGRFSYAQGECR